MSVHFDERSGVVPCHTPWGCWSQTMEDVFIEVQVPPGTQAREIQCKLGSRDIALTVQGRDILKAADEMQKKLTLERFQRENPGFDFSGA
ncbi:hypothetical protein FKM82_012008 [Ascaphus truei]